MPPWQEICSDLSWHTYLLDGGYFQKKHFGRCGVYRLVALEDAGNVKKPATFSRIRGQDPTGTLYIGETGWLNERLNQMRRGEHNAMQTLRRVPVLDFPRAKLAISLLFTGTSTRFIEQSLFDAYMKTFGDTPPLNYKI